MKADTSLSLVQAVIDSQKDLVVLFYKEEPVLINRAFKSFVGTSSLEEYKKESISFVDNFVHHPSYFHSQKMESNENWYDAILKLPEIERVVSMMSSNYEPYAFSVNIAKVQEYTIATFTDITQTLIKRIMIEDHSNMDAKSGAYSKKYFIQIAQSYQDVADFNKKTVAIITIKAVKTDDYRGYDDESTIRQLTDHFKGITRQDDMLIRWNDDTFLLIYLADNPTNAKMMLEKLYNISKENKVNGISCSFELVVQKEKESVEELIQRADS